MWHLAHKSLRWCIFNSTTTFSLLPARTWASSEQTTPGKSWGRAMGTHPCVGWIWAGLEGFPCFFLAVFLLFLVSAELPQNYLGFSQLMEGRAHQAWSSTFVHALHNLSIAWWTKFVGKEDREGIFPLEPARPCPPLGKFNTCHCISSHLRWPFVPFQTKCVCNSWSTKHRWLAWVGPIWSQFGSNVWFMGEGFASCEKQCRRRMSPCCPQNYFYSLKKSVCQHKRWSLKSRATPKPFFAVVICFLYRKRNW